MAQSKRGKQQRPSDDLPTRETRCRLCLEPMRPGAKKCIQCDAFQDWRRLLNLSSSVLALLVALVSVLSVVLPDVMAALAEDSSRTTISTPQFENDLVSLIATNEGNQPSIVQAWEMVLERSDGERWEARLEPNFSTMIVHPGAPRLATARLFPVDVESLLEWTARATGLPSARILRVEVKEFSGAISEVTFEIDEATYRRMINTLRHSRQFWNLQNGSLPPPPPLVQ